MHYRVDRQEKSLAYGEKQRNNSVTKAWQAVHFYALVKQDRSTSFLEARVLGTAWSLPKKLKDNEADEMKANQRYE